MNAICRKCLRPLMYAEYLVHGDLCQKCWEKELKDEEKKGERLAKAKI
jgi:hypothetical protein